MPLAKVKDILKHAMENKYGVAAINTLNYETTRCAILAAEREKMPVIIQFYPGLDKYCPSRYIAYMAKDMAREATVPVAVHLDHSSTYDIAVSGIRDGFPSVMVDGSSLPYEENVRLTASVVKVARIFGVDVEAELGHVGAGSNLDDIINTDYYTDAEQAADFVEHTGCDSLAIAVGNAHGNYVKKPDLDFERIRKIRQAVSVPLVLHGCSGIPDEQMIEAVNLGLNKFNIATEYFNAMYRSFQNQISNKALDGNGIALMQGIQEAMIEFVIGKIRLLNPNKFTLR